MKIEDLKKDSPFTYIFERTFFILQWLSPATILFGSRVKSQEKLDLSENSVNIVKKRGRQIEGYVGFWFVLLIVCAFSVMSKNYWLHSIAVFLPLLRIFDIIQTAINMNFFDRIRLGERKHYVLGVTRTLVLSIWNFLKYYSVLVSYIVVCCANW